VEEGHRRWAPAAARAFWRRRARGLPAAGGAGGRGARADCRAPAAVRPPAAPGGVQPTRGCRARRAPTHGGPTRRLQGKGKAGVSSRRAPPGPDQQLGQGGASCRARAQRGRARVEARLSKGWLPRRWLPPLTELVAARIAHPQAALRRGAVVCAHCQGGAAGRAGHGRLGAQAEEAGRGGQRHVRGHALGPCHQQRLGESWGSPGKRLCLCTGCGRGPAQHCVAQPNSCLRFDWALIPGTRSRLIAAQRGCNGSARPVALALAPKTRNRTHSSKTNSFNWADSSMTNSFNIVMANRTQCVGAVEGGRTAPPSRRGGV
jgi:hypothetical protein